MAVQGTDTEFCVPSDIFNPDLGQEHIYKRMNVFQGREFKNLCSSDSCLKKTFVFNACTNHVSAEQQDFTKTQKIAIPLNA